MKHGAFVVKHLSAKDWHFRFSYGHTFAFSRALGPVELKSNINDI